MLTADKNTPGSIARWVNDSRIQGDVPEIILEAESWIYRRLRHWRMLTLPTTGNMTIGTPSIALPGDCLEPFYLCTTGINQQNLIQRTPQEVIQNWTYDGNGNRVQQQPLMYYLDQANINFDSPPDQAYPYAFLYFQQPQPLSVSVSNFLTQYYPRLVRLCCVAAACEWMKDSGQGQFDRTYYDQLAQEEVEKAQVESDRARRGTVAGAVIIGGGGATTNYPFITPNY